MQTNTHSLIIIISIQNRRWLYIRASFAINTVIMSLDMIQYRRTATAKHIAIICVARFVFPLVHNQSIDVARRRDRLVRDVADNIPCAFAFCLRSCRMEVSELPFTIYSCCALCPVKKTASGIGQAHYRISITAHATEGRMKSTVMTVVVVVVDRQRVAYRFPLHLRLNRVACILAFVASMLVFCHLPGPHARAALVRKTMSTPMGLRIKPWNGLFNDTPHSSVPHI